jgi:hypothetical protein
MGGHKRSALVLVLAALVLGLTPRLALAQTGSISGVVRDSQGGVLPGVTVEVSSPQLIEKVRSTVTDDNGRYQIVRLPVGKYTVSFKLEKFATVERSNVDLTSDFTAPVNADMKLGATSEVVTVQAAAAALVDVQNARQRQVFQREELADLPITRNVNSLLQLVPGIAITASNAGNSAPRICSGGQADAGVGTGFGNATGATSGCNPLLQTFNAHASINDTESQNQGRMQVDGLNIQGASATGTGRTAYVADVSNAQEVTFTLSGSLGESETGGTTINIIPRTGGNRYNGNFFAAYSGDRFYGKNDGTRPSSLEHRLLHEYDINGSYGGPIVRDRLWFYGSARRQDRENFLFVGYRNLNEGQFGANYQYDPDNRLHQTDEYQNASLRLTWQATQKDKFNIFWDEQKTCENPCVGPAAGVSPEGSSSLLTRPIHLAQLSWTNPITNTILLEGAFSHYGAHRDESKAQGEPVAYPSIPTVFENGTTAMLAPGATGTQMQTGSINNALINNVDNIQSRASASYVTGSHNVKLGYQGIYSSRSERRAWNDLRLRYTYLTPTIPSLCTTAACSSYVNAPSNSRVVLVSNPAGGQSVQNGCYFNPVPLTGTAIPQQVGANATTFTDRPWCGAINLPGNPGGLNDPINSRLLPIPSSFIQYIPSELDETVWGTSFYLQDQWTLNRFTFSGALRYDNAQSKFGKTCVNADLYNPNSAYCLNDPSDPLNGGGTGKGVYFQDITPRWQVTWDVFGNGRTAIKYSQGKYLDGLQVGGVYTATNPAAANRTINNFTRNWIDADGDRRVDCDLVIPAVVTSTGIPASGECLAAGSAGSGAGGSIENSRRFGRSPAQLDANNLAIGLGTVYCGQDEPSMRAEIRTYCDSYFAQGGESLLTGWNKRRYEWQLLLGVQHELLPRLSAEVTYNRRVIGNQTVGDQLGVGCDLYGSTSTPVDPEQCMTDLLNGKSTFYDFYSIQAPADPSLPHAGGYLVSNIATPKQVTGTTAANVSYVQAPNGLGVTAVTLAQGRRKDVWRGVDTNFVLRARGGLRISGGTSTGKRTDNQCELLFDGNPPTGQILRLDNFRDCENVRPFQTNVRGTASYTIPWIDVLFSSTFSYRPGVQVTGTYTVPNGEVIWQGNPTQTQTGNPRVAGLIQNSQNNGTTVATNLLNNTFYGEGIRLFDIRLAKNIRFAGKRVNIGADVFNVFNSDAALQYCGTIPNPAINPQACGTTANPQVWRQVTNITTPRFARFQVQFDF